MWIAKCAPLAFASNKSLALLKPPVRETVKENEVTPGGLQQLSVTSKFPNPSICPPPGAKLQPPGRPVIFRPAVEPTMLNPKIPLLPEPDPNAVNAAVVCTVTSILAPLRT